MDRAMVIRLDFDRRMAPASVGMESVRLFSGARSIPLTVEIDVVRPGLVLTPWVVLDPEVTYVLEVDRLRDLDGNVGDASAPMMFHTGRASDGAPAQAPPTFEEVLPIFAARCATDACHGGARPILGLDLTSAESVGRTAIGMPAREVRRPVEGATPSGPALAGLSIVERGTPARSYLVYKLLGDPHAPGSPMPPETGEGGEGMLSPTEIGVIVSWIQGGAVLPDPS